MPTAVIIGVGPGLGMLAYSDSELIHSRHRHRRRGTRLGLAIAHRFGAEGYQVALIARNQQKVDGLAAQLALGGPRRRLRRRRDAAGHAAIRTRRRGRPLHSGALLFSTGGSSVRPRGGTCGSIGIAATSRRN